MSGITFPSTAMPEKSLPICKPRLNPNSIGSRICADWKNQERMILMNRVYTTGSVILCLCLACAVQGQGQPASHAMNMNMETSHEHSMAAPPVTFAELETTAAQLEKARRATEKYRNVQMAEADGYKATGPDVPGMGIHYVHLQHDHRSNPGSQAA